MFRDIVSACTPVKLIDMYTGVALVRMYPLPMLRHSSWVLFPAPGLDRSRPMIPLAAFAKGMFRCLCTRCR